MPGRLQRVDLGPAAPAVYVDFAHTPQAVAAALHALGGSGSGPPGMHAGDRRRIAVLGSGGDRDPLKRGSMGEAAAHHADLVVITDDNPRSEAPEAIRAQVLTGARAAVQRDALATEVLDGGDRRSAIRQALEHAGPGDVVAVLGRGHEPDQEIAGGRVPFSDAAVVAEEWAALQGVRR